MTDQLRDRRVPGILVVPAALALFATLVLPQPFGRAGESDHEGHAPAVLTEAESIRQDAEAYAKDFGVSIEEAERRLTIQVRLAPVFGSIEEAAPDRFAGAWLQHQPTYRIVASFTGMQAGFDAVAQIASAAPSPPSTATTRSTWGSTTSRA